MDVTEEAAERSVDLLTRARTPAGFVASHAFDHYSVIWARDALISSLGALSTGYESLAEGVACTLDSVTSRMSEHGQLPAVVSLDRLRWDFGEGGTVDTTAWLPIVVAAYIESTGDEDRAAQWWTACLRAMQWLAHQDVTGSGLVSVAPSTDWMDAALTRSGRTLHMNVLYAWASDSMVRIAAALGRPHTVAARSVSGLVNAWFWPETGMTVDDLHANGFLHSAIKGAHSRLASLPRDHYVSHIVHAGFIDVCDVLANCLSIVAGVADPDRSRSILEFVALPPRNHGQPARFSNRSRRGRAMPC
jgi:hypothetical protein